MKAPLPTVEGVGPSCQWLPAGPWKTVIDFFKEKYPRVDATTWNARMAKGQVMDETGRRVDSETPFRVGACIFYYRELENENPIPFVEQVLYRDEHILVTPLDDEDFSKPLKLLAKSISFLDPLSGRQHYFESSTRL